MPDPGRAWTVEEANTALPMVRSALRRIQALLPAGAELRAAVEELTGAGIVLRDLDAGLVDFPARLPDGREYLLCWVLDEPEVAWWHWPDTGFAGRRPLADPPA